MAKASEKFVRVIVRRPHAYRFRKDHPSSPIPGMVILDAEGAFVAGFAFKGEDQAKRLAAELEKHAK